MYWLQNIHDKLGEKRKPQLCVNLLLKNIVINAWEKVWKIYAKLLRIFGSPPWNRNGKGWEMKTSSFTFLYYFTVSKGGTLFYLIIKLIHIYIHQILRWLFKKLVTWKCSLYFIFCWKSNMQNSNYSMSSIDKIYRSICSDRSVINTPNVKRILKYLDIRVIIGVF